MQTPKVDEISALSAHRREVALVRWSLAAVPAQRGERPSTQDPPGPNEPRLYSQDFFSRTW